jgi:hypothetical protein
MSNPKMITFMMSGMFVIVCLFLSDLEYGILTHFAAQSMLKGKPAAVDVKLNEYEADDWQQNLHLNKGLLVFVALYL